MSDPIQSRSSIPVPLHQTLEGSRDPVPPNTPKSIETADKTVHASDTERTETNFEDYLNQTSITTLEKAQQGLVFDPAKDIAGASPYQKPGETTPV